MITHSFTIAKSTPESARAIERFKVSGGILSRVLIGFPPGCLGLAHAVLFYQDYMIEPWNRDGSFYGDDYIFDFECEHLISPPDTEITAQGWNLDDDNPHTILLGFDVTQPPEFTPEEELAKLNAALGIE